MSEQCSRCGNAGIHAGQAASPTAVPDASQRVRANTVEEAIAELQMGRCIMVVDDPNRENEGDLICAAEYATQANVNFMASRAEGPHLHAHERARSPGSWALTPMVTNNTDNHETAFTVSIDHVSTTTGISAAERSVTAMKAVEDDARPEDFRRPGHMFPLHRPSRRRARA